MIITTGKHQKKAMEKRVMAKKAVHRRRPLEHTPGTIQVIPGYNVKRAKMLTTWPTFRKTESKSIKGQTDSRKDSALSVIIRRDENGEQSICLKRGHQRLE
ncbi:hypothetical protein D0O09_31895, partial [Pseudomonas putida]